MIGSRLTLDVGAVAHGGTCVARHEGRVVFVRHALPGERVTAVVTDGGEGDRYLRADVVEVIDSAAGRVEPPCTHAHAGGCGGCDWQHVELAVQRDLKASVIAEQLERLANINISVVVEPVGREARDDEGAGLGWRTRVGFAVAPGGELGLRRSRSHDVEVLNSCPIADPAINAAMDQAPVADASSVAMTAPGAKGAEKEVAIVTRDADGRVLQRSGPSTMTHTFRGRSFVVDAEGFWQVHPAAAETLVDAVLDMLGPQPGEHALDLYAGVGLFAAFLAEAVGPTGGVTVVEGSKRAAARAASNLAEFSHVTIHAAPVDWWARRAADRPAQPVAIVVLDPPRKGATRAVIDPVVALAPRAIAYVACDPASLARDTAILAEHGYRLERLRAFDLFPMTHHVECVASFVRA